MDGIEGTQWNTGRKVATGTWCRQRRRNKLTDLVSMLVLRHLSSVGFGVWILDPCLKFQGVTSLRDVTTGSSFEGGKTSPTLTLLFVLRVCIWRRDLSPSGSRHHSTRGCSGTRSQNQLPFSKLPLVTLLSQPQKHDWHGRSRKKSTQDSRLLLIFDRLKSRSRSWAGI